MHLVEATDRHLDDLAQPYRAVARDRATSVPRWLKVRLALLLLLSPSLVATVGAMVLSWFPGTADAAQALDFVARLAGAASLALAGAFLLVSRHIGQMERDLVACLALGTGLRGKDK